MSALARRRPALCVAVITLLVGAVALSGHQSAPRLSLSPRIAIHDALKLHAFSHLHYTHISVSAVDRELVRVAFYDGAQIAAQVAVRRDGSISQAANFTKSTVPYGDWIAYQPAVLAGMAVLFVLAAGVAPLRRRRNLDVVAALSLLAPVVLLQHRYLGASVLSAVPGLWYLLWRCARIALGSAPVVNKESTPLLDRLTPGLGAGERVRVLRLLLLALALVIAMVGISSINAVDVIYAVMEGATKLIHGVLPYGHLPGDVVHGDTYPILSYVLYTPLAWLSPVNSNWDSVDGALIMAVLAALLSAAGAYFVTGGVPVRRRRARAIEPEAEAAGLRAALACLSFPLVMISVSTGTTDLVLGSMLAIAIVLWRRPAVSAAWIAAGAWFKLAPVALLPMWLAPLRGRRLVAALAAVAGVSVAMLALVIGLAGLPGITGMIHGLSFQFSRGSPQSLWSELGVESLQPVAQAAVLALIAGSVVRLRREPELAADRGRMAALAAAVLLGLQLSADYWAFLYVVWVVPLLTVSLFAEQVPEALPMRAVAARALPVMAAVPGQ